MQDSGIPHEKKNKEVLEWGARGTMKGDINIEV